MARDFAMRAYQEGQYERAAGVAYDIWQTQSQLLGETADDTLLTASFLARALGAAGYPDHALDWAMDTYNQRVERDGADAQRSHIEAINLLAALVAQNRAADGLGIAVLAVRHAEVAFGPDHPRTIQWRTNLAAAMEQMGYGEAARWHYARALEGYVRHETDQAREGAAAASKLMARALERAPEQPEYIARVTEAYDKALALNTAAYGAAHPQVFGLLTHAAGFVLDHGDLALAEQFVERAEAQVPAQLAPTSPEMVRLKAVKGRLALARGEIPQGIIWLEEAADLLQEVWGVGNARSGQIFLDLSEAYHRVGNAEFALLYARMASDAGYTRGNLHLELLRAKVERGEKNAVSAAGEAFYVLQLNHQTMAENAVELMNARLIAARSGALEAHREFSDLQYREFALRDRLVALSLDPASASDAGEAERLAQAVIDAWDATVERQEMIRAAVPDYDQRLRGEQQLSLETIQALLGEDEALVLLDAAEEGGHIIAVSREDVLWVPLEAGQAALTEKVTALRAGISLKLGVRAATALQLGGPKPADFDLDAAHWLYAETVGRVESVLAGKAHVYVDLRGPMSAVPPQMLLTAPSDQVAGAPWLVRRHAITVIPSVMSLRTATLLSAVEQAEAPLLGFGDPVFTGDAPQLAGMRGGLAPLPETAGELRAVAMSLSAGEEALRLGARASEAEVKSADLESAQVLYFATHGLVAGDSVGSGALSEPALALTAGGGEDGFLSSSEIMQLRLNADWVVLSACNTAVGEEPGAEALSGLAQAFLYAGARALLVSHWPVESQSAAHLMADVFARRSAAPGLRAAQAQQQAMLAMIDAPLRSGWDHPAYWAPFVLVGDPG